MVHRRVRAIAAWAGEKVKKSDSFSCYPKHFRSHQPWTITKVVDPLADCQELDCQTIVILYVIPNQPESGGTCWEWSEPTTNTSMFCFDLEQQVEFNTFPIIQELGAIGWYAGRLLFNYVIYIAKLPPVEKLHFAKYALWTSSFFQCHQDEGNVPLTLSYLACLTV